MKKTVTCALCIRMGSFGATFDPNAHSDLLAHMQKEHWYGSNEIAEVLADSCFFACNPNDLTTMDREGEDLLLALRPNASGSGVATGPYPVA